MCFRWSCHAAISLRLHPTGRALVPARWVVVVAGRTCGVVPHGAMVLIAEQAVQQIEGPCSSCSSSPQVRVHPLAVVFSVAPVRQRSAASAAYRGCSAKWRSPMVVAHCAAKKPENVFPVRRPARTALPPPASAPTAPLPAARGRGAIIRPGATGDDLNAEGRPHLDPGAACVYGLSGQAVMARTFSASRVSADRVRSTEYILGFLDRSVVHRLVLEQPGSWCRGTFLQLKIATSPATTARSRLPRPVVDDVQSAALRAGCCIRSDSDAGSGSRLPVRQPDGGCRLGVSGMPPVERLALCLSVCAFSVSSTR